jgi:ATP-binding cassette, sub-family E, member 1
MPPKKKAGKDEKGEDQLTRIAIIHAEKCKPKKCKQECKKSCPVVKLGKLCIEVTPKSKLAFISEPLCIGKLMTHRNPTTCPTSVGDGHVSLPRGQT